jgi:hypothetical protein
MSFAYSSLKSLAETVGRLRRIVVGLAVAVLVGAVLASSPACSGEPRAGEESIGFVVAVRGNVEAIEGEGASRRLRIMDRVYGGDALRTGTRDRLQVMLADGTIVDLGKNSEIQIAEFDWDANARAGKMTVRPRKGTFRVLGGTITEVAPVQFMTRDFQDPISIRGTFYAGRLVGRRFSVVLLGGDRMVVSNKAGSVTITKPLHGTTLVAADIAPEIPARLAPEELAYLRFGSAGGGEDQTAASDASDGEEQLFEFDRWGYWDAASGSAEDSPSWADERSLAAQVRDLIDMTRTAQFSIVSAGGGGGAGGCPT